MKTKTKRKDIKDLHFPCYFRAITEFREGMEDPVAAIDARHSELLETNPYLREIRESNARFIQSLLPKTDAEVPDEDFFAYIGYSPEILGSRFAQEKMLRWQNEMYDKNSSVASKAEDNLKRIGRELALKGKRSPDTILLAGFYRDFIGAMLDAFNIDGFDEFLQCIEGDLGIDIRNDEDIAPVYMDIAHRRNIPRLINLIISRMMKLSEGTVKQYLKLVTEVYDNDRKIGFAIETEPPTTK